MAKKTPKKSSKPASRPVTAALPVQKISTPAADHMELLTAYLTSTVTTHLGNLAVHLQELINSIDALVENPTEFLESQGKASKASTPRAQTPVEDEPEDDEDEPEDDEDEETVAEDDSDDEEEEPDDDGDETVDEDDDAADWDDDDVEDEPAPPARRSVPAGRNRR